MCFLESRFYFFPHKSDPIRFELINVHMLKVFFFCIRQKVKGLPPREEKAFSWETSLLQYVCDIPAPHAELCHGGQINYGP